MLLHAPHYPKRDTEDSFFYMNPLYVRSDQGHYDGYSQEDFDALFGTLEAIKGRFLLSSYRNKALANFTKRNGWHTVEIRMACAMNKKKHKIEVLTANYPIGLES